MKGLKLRTIARSIGAEYLGEDITIGGISTDTRTIKNGDLFVCIKGDNFDGHNFALQAVRSGAAAVVSSKNISDLGVPVLMVGNTIGALINIAALHRSFFDVKMVGVTGSVGKTSTKEMIYAALSSHYETLKTEENLNNEIGLSHTLLRLNETDEAAVIEMGMENKGEIDVLARAVKPEVAVITNIGVSHIENLKTRENILKAKLEIENGLSENGIMVLNGDNDLLSTTRGKLKHKTLYYGIKAENLDVYADDIKTQGFETSFVIHSEGNSYNARIPTIGEHNVLNALAAFTVCRALKLSPDKTIPGLMNFSSPGARQKIHKTENDITVIEDCYNASPDSMNAALWVLSNVGGERKIAVLGDMLELGDISEESHIAVGKKASEAADVVFAYGYMAEYIASAAKENGTESYWFDNKKELSKALSAHLKKNDAVLFKASRGMKFEEIIEEVFGRN